MGREILKVMNYMVPKWSLVAQFVFFSCCTDRCKFWSNLKILRLIAEYNS